MADVSRVFLIVLDSFGVGEAPDAAAYGDAGSNTLRACFATGELSVPVMASLGLYNIEGVGCGTPVAAPVGAFARLREASAGKDTTIGHWEIAGILSTSPMPTYPHGFPRALLAELERRTGRGTLCNKPYSGTQVLADFGREHMETGALIVYTSADSVFQVAAHEGVVPLDELYRACEMARALLTGEHSVGRVIARPFTGEYPDFTRTTNRRDFSLEPPGTTFLDEIAAAGLATYGVGKIHDIFAGRGVQHTQHTDGNDDGMEKTLALAKQSWRGLCFVNLVDFDMLYGHRNDAVGYAKALSRADAQLGALMALMKPDDVLLVTADHGCDPSTKSTDHSREYVPLLAYGKHIRAGANLGTRPTFADVGKTAAALLGVNARTAGEYLQAMCV